MKWLSTYLGKSLPTIDFFFAGEREVNDGENEGRLERRNGRMKVFIGVQILRVADMSTLGMINREERWTGRKSISIVDSSTGFEALRKNSL